MKRFRMFAGPNGSGKSTLINMIKTRYNIGYFINADNIERELNQYKSVNCSDYLPINVSQTVFDNFWNDILKHDLRISRSNLDKVKIIDNYLVVEQKIHSYTAAIIAEFFRFILAECDKSFSFETVMSHESKIAYLETIRKKGFKTYLYYISTQDPSINQNRVKIRVEKGGHDVDQDKIESRYFRSMQLLSNAFMVVDRAFIIDSSTDDKRTVYVEKDKDELKILKSEIPEWIVTYLIDKLD